MRLDGRSTDQITETVGIRRRTLYIWFSDPLVKAELTRQLVNVNQLFAEKCAAASLAGIDALMELVRQEPEGPISHETRLEVVRVLLDLHP